MPEVGRCALEAEQRAPVRADDDLGARHHGVLQPARGMRMRVGFFLDELISAMSRLHIDFSLAGRGAAGDD
jgi:hypothetical protein